MSDNTPPRADVAFIFAHLHATHPSERKERVADIAAWLFKAGYASVNEHDRVVYTREARAYVPRAFPTPKIAKDPEALVDRYLRGVVMLPSEEPTPRAPRPVPKNIQAADAMHDRIADRFSVYNGARDAALRSEPANLAGAREAGKAALAALDTPDEN